MGHAENTKLYAGIEAGGTKFNCVIGTDPLNIVARTKIATTTPEQTLPQVRDFFLGHGVEPGQLAGLGIACFGPVDLHLGSPSYGCITSTPKPGWSNTEVAGYFSRELALPVKFDTDVNGSALGEHLHGAAQGLDDFVYITIGTGIGAGVFANGRPLNGHIHTELGHQLIARLPQDSISFTGCCPFHDNCLSDLACGPALEARWQTRAEHLPADHPAWDLQAHYLAVMCVNVTLSYSPRLIILGGGVMQQAQLYPLIREKFKTLMNAYMMPKVNLDQYIVAPGLSACAGEVGALVLAMQA